MVTYLRHEAQSINEFGVAVAVLLADTVGDDVVGPHGHAYPNQA